MYPNEIVRSRIADDRVRIPFVHLLISLPICRVEITKILQIVKERPDHLVGITVVEFVPLGFAQGNRHHVVTGVASGFGQRLVRDFTGNSGPTNPRPTALAQHRLNCGNKSADSRRDRPEILACRIEGEWQSIGNNYQTVHFNERQKVSLFMRASTIQLRARRSLCAKA